MDIDRTELWDWIMISSNQIVQFFGYQYSTITSIDQYL